MCYTDSESMLNNIACNYVLSLLADDFDPIEDGESDSQSNESGGDRGLRPTGNMGRTANAKGRRSGDTYDDSGRGVRRDKPSLHASRRVKTTYTRPEADTFIPTTNPTQMPIAPGCFWVPVQQGSSSQDMRTMFSGLPQQNFPMNWNFAQVNRRPSTTDSQGACNEEKELDSDSQALSLKEDSIKKRIRRASKRDADEAAKKREIAGLPPYVVQVKPSGIIDSACAGHLKWHEYIRNLTPRMLDMSVIKFEDQYDDSKIKLREALRKKFEFLDHEVPDAAMDKMVKTWMRKDRERMKRRHAGKLKAPPRYSEKEWDAMKKHWDTPSSKEESERMIEKRKKVARNPRVGRLGYAGKAAKLVSTKPELM